MGEGRREGRQGRQGGKERRGEGGREGGQEREGGKGFSRVLVFFLCLLCFLFLSLSLLLFVM